MTTSIGSELNKIFATKEDIKSAIEAKGVTVNSQVFADYASKIGEIISPNTDLITGRIDESVSKGDILFLNGKGFNKSVESTSIAPWSYGYEIAFASHQGDLYAAVGQGIAPFVATYKLIGGAWVMLEHPTQRLVSAVTGVALKSYKNKLYLAVAHGTTPFITIYSLVGTDWVVADNPDSGLAGIGRGASFEIYNDNLYLFAVHSTSPFVTEYKLNRNSNLFEKLSQPPTLPAGIGYGVSSTVYKGELFIAVAHATTPFVRSYRKNTETETWTVIANPGTLPASTGQGIKISALSDGLYLSVAHSSSPYVRNYKWNDDTQIWELMPTPAVADRPPSTAYKSIIFEDNGKTYYTVAHNLSPWIATYRLDGLAWTRMAEASPLKHSFTSDSFLAFYFETYKWKDKTYMLASFAQQPFMKAYLWDSVQETWSDQLIQDLFPAPTGAVNNPETISFKGDTYMVFAHATTPFVTTYRRDSQRKAWDLLTRPDTLPASTASGSKMVVYNNELYLSIAHTTTPFFRLYKMNETTYQWEALAPPNSGDLPAGNGIETSARVFNNTLYVSIIHTTTPFVTTYTWNDDTWTRLPNPSTLPPSNGLDGAMKVFNGELYLAVAHATSPFVTAYKLSAGVWVNVPRNMNPPGAGGGVDFEEVDGEFYLAVGSSTAPYHRLYRLISGTFTSESTNNLMKLANATRVALYTANEDLFFAIHQGISFNRNSLSIFKKNGDLWVSYFCENKPDASYGLRFYFFENELYLIAGTLYPPYVSIYKLSDYAGFNAWNKTNIDQKPGAIGIAAESGVKGDLIQILKIGAGGV